MYTHGKGHTGNGFQDAWGEGGYLINIIGYAVLYKMAHCVKCSQLTFGESAKISWSKNGFYNRNIYKKKLNQWSFHVVKSLAICNQCKSHEL